MPSFCKTALTIMLIAFVAGHNTPLYATEEKTSKPISIIKPKKKVTKVKSSAIDTENYELGIIYGSLSVEDFSTNPLTGLSMTYHFNSTYMAQLIHTRSEVDKATFEQVIGLNFLREGDRKFKSTQLQVGYQLFHGRSFQGAQKKFNSHIYLTAGVEQVKFAGDSQVGMTVGATYKIVTTDWLTLDLNLRNHFVNRDFLSDNKQTSNIEFSIGVNALF